MSLLSQPSKSQSEESEQASGYQPSLNRHARSLIARIQKNQDDVEAIHQLAAHYEQTADQPSLVNLMEGWGDSLREPRAAADAYVRAADAALVGLRDRTRARTLYERALSRDASHTEALDRVQRILNDDENFERSKHVLKFVEYKLSETGGDARLHASVCYRLGQVYEAHFAEPGKAVANYRKAIELNPQLVPAIIAARKIYHGVGNRNAVAMLYEFEIEATQSTDDKRGLLVALAELRHREEHNSDAAITALRRAMSLVPGDIEALRLLGEVLVARSERGDKASGAVDRRRAAEVFYQLGRSLPAQDARAYLLRALELCPEHDKATTLLHELGTRERPDDKTQMLDLAELDAAERADETPGPATGAAGVLARDSVEEWLNEREHAGTALSTGELSPIEIHAIQQPPERPSSLPPRALAEGLVAAGFPPHEALRAPRLPALASAPMGVPALATPAMGVPAPASISSRPPTPPGGVTAWPPPSTTGRRSSPPPPPPAGIRSRTAPPPAASVAHAEPPLMAAAMQTQAPAYAEIPGAATEDFTPIRSGSRKFAPAETSAHEQGQPGKREPTLIGWQLDQSESEEEIAELDPQQDALTPAMNDLPPVKPEYEYELGQPARQVDSPLARLAVTSTRTASGVESPAPSPAPAVGSSRPLAPRVQAALDDRFADLARGAREKVVSLAVAQEPEPSFAEANPFADPEPFPLSAPDSITLPTAAAAETAPVIARVTPVPALVGARVTPVPAPVAMPSAMPPTAAESRPPLRARVISGALPNDAARTTVEVNVGATTDSNFYVGFSNRVVEGGLFVATYNPLPVGSAVDLVITLPGNFNARAHGSVRLVRNTLDPFSDDVPGMCVQLEALNEEALELFERFTSHRTPVFIDA